MLRAPISENYSTRCHGHDIQQPIYKRNKEHYKPVVSQVCDFLYSILIKKFFDFTMNKNLQLI